MKFYKELYTGEAAGKKLKKILRSIKTGKYMSGVYVIALSACKDDLLDLMPAYMLRARRYAGLEILGVAATKEEAMDVGRMIIEDVYEKTGGYDIRAYFGG